MSAPAHTIVFTPSGRRGEVPDGASVLDAARALGVDLDSVCGGRGICGRCQVVPMEGSFPKHGLIERGRPPDPVHRARGAVPRARRPGGRPPARMPREDLRRPGGRRAPGVADPPPGRAQGGRRPPDRRRPGRAAALRRGGGADARDDRRRSRASARRPRARLGPRRARRRSRRAARASADASGRRMDRDGGGARRLADHGDIPGVPRRGARGGVRRGLDDGGRTPVRPAHRRRARERRRDEPADPVRRGPHEPGELRDDASGRRGGVDRGGPRVPRPTGGRPLCAGRRRARRRARARRGRQSDHAPPRLRVRPDRARWRAVRAGHRPCAHRAGSRPGCGRQPWRARVRVAVDRRPRRRRHRRCDPQRGAVRPGCRQPAGRRRDQRRDRAREPRSTARRLQPDGTRLRGCADLVRPAGRARRDRARPHRPGHPRAPVPHGRQRRVVRRARRAHPDTASAARASSSWSPSSTWRASSPPTA